MLKVVHHAGDVSASNDEDGGSLLDHIVRDGARHMLAAALRAEVAAYVEEHGRRLVVRNGYHAEREVTTAAGAVPVRAPRVNHKRIDSVAGQRKGFASPILPAWARKSPREAEGAAVAVPAWAVQLGLRPGVGAVLRHRLQPVTDPDHSAHGPVAGRGEGVYRAVLGRHRLCVRPWVDGVHLKVRLEQDKVWLLVMIGVRADGTKELIALDEGPREGSESRADLLRSAKRSGQNAVTYISLPDKVWDMTTRTTVYLSGGLGNQLHQLSVAVGIAQYAPVVASTAILGSSSRSLAAAAAFEKCGIDVLDTRCCEGPVGVTPLREVDPAAPPCCLLSYPEDADWLGHNTDAKGIRGAISAMLESSPLPTSRAEGNSHQIAMHFRFGDYLWPRAATRFGVLTRAYYESVVRLLPRGVEVNAYTDDPKATRRLIGGTLGDAPVIVHYGSSVISDFASMATSTYFVAANSTLSLWVVWYRDDPTRTFAPAWAYRSPPGSSLPGLGNVEPRFHHPAALTIAHPWVLTRRLQWRERYWL